MMLNGTVHAGQKEWTMAASLIILNAEREEEPRLLALAAGSQCTNRLILSFNQLNRGVVTIWMT